jgi:hypothetical protein
VGSGLIVEDLLPSDPDRALRNLLTRDRMFTAHLAMTEDDLTELVEKAVGLCSVLQARVSPSRLPVRAEVRGRPGRAVVS